MSHRARLNVSASVLKAVTGWIAQHRRRPGSRPGQRAGTVHVQVALALRWLRHRLDLRTLAAEAGLSIAITSTLEVTWLCALCAVRLCRLLA